MLACLVQAGLGLVQVALAGSVVCGGANRALVQAALAGSVVCGANRAQTRLSCQGCIVLAKLSVLPVWKRAT